MGAIEDSVEAFISEASRVWDANDGDAFGRLFVDDASLINPFGERADGLAALTAMYRAYFDGMLRGTTTTMHLTHLRTVGEHYALADADQTIYGSDGAVLLDLHVVNLLINDGESWLLVDSRPYSFPPSPT